MTSYERPLGEIFRDDATWEFLRVAEGGCRGCRFFSDFRCSIDGDDRRRAEAGECRPQFRADRRQVMFELYKGKRRYELWSEIWPFINKKELWFDTDQQAIGYAIQYNDGGLKTLFNDKNEKIYDE